MLNDLLYFVNTYMKDVSFFIFCKYASLLLTFSWYWVWFRFSRKHVFLRPSLTVQQLQNERRDNSHFFYFCNFKGDIYCRARCCCCVCVCCAHHARLICIRLISPTCLEVDFCKAVQKRFRTFFLFFAKKCEKCKLI